ncbi:PAS domain S-box protein [Thiovibrio sp. JS02]
MYRELIECANDPIFVADAQSGEILFANTKAATLLGRPRENLVGLHQSALHPADRREEYKALFNASAKKKSSVFNDLAVQHCDGSEIPVEISSRAASFEGRKVIIGIFRDTRDRKIFPKALREQENRFSALAASSSDMIHLNDREGRILYANPATEQLLGYGLEEVLGKEAFLFIHPDDRKTIARDMAQTFAGQKRPDREIRLLRKDGATIFVEVKGFLVDVGSGENYVGAIIRDVTKRKKADSLQRKQTAELAALNDALRLLIEQNSKALIEQERTIHNNLQHQVFPYLEQLAGKCATVEGRELLGLIRHNLEKITSFFPQEITREIPDITPREFEIASLIQRGKSTKEISLLLSLSPRTVECHRDTIRKKLGLTGRRVTLRAHLATLG